MGQEPPPSQESLSSRRLVNNLPQCVALSACPNFSPPPPCGVLPLLQPCPPPIHCRKSSAWVDAVGTQCFWWMYHQHIGRALEYTQHRLLLYSSSLGVVLLLWRCWFIIMGLLYSCTIDMHVCEPKYTREDNIVGRTRIGRPLCVGKMCENTKVAHSSNWNLGGYREPKKGRIRG